MHIVAVNAGPRRNGNTAALLRHALEGAQSAAGPEARRMGEALVRGVGAGA